MFTRILVPTDFSPCADVALNHARAIAERFGASLHLLHVVRDPVTTTVTGPGIESYDHHYAAHFFDSVSDFVELRDVLLREAGRQIVQRITALDRTGLHAAGEAVIGLGVRTVVEYAESYGADLIVMGTHGGGMSQLPIGRFAGRVIRTAPCAVMSICEGRAKRSCPDAKGRLKGTRGETRRTGELRANEGASSESELKRPEPQQRFVGLFAGMVGTFLHAGGMRTGIPPANATMPGGAAITRAATSIDITMITAHAA